MSQEGHPSDQRPFDAVACAATPAPPVKIHMGVAFSGGGLRAFSCAADFTAVLLSLELWPRCTTAAGVSGGSWFLAAYFAANGRAGFAPDVALCAQRLRWLAAGKVASVATAAVVGAVRGWTPRLLGGRAASSPSPSPSASVELAPRSHGTFGGLCSAMEALLPANAALRLRHGEPEPLFCFGESGDNAGFAQRAFTVADVNVRVAGGGVVWLGSERPVPRPFSVAAMMAVCGAAYVGAGVANDSGDDIFFAPEGGVGGGGSAPAPVLAAAASASASVPLLEEEAVPEAAARQPQWPRPATTAVTAPAAAATPVPPLRGRRYVRDAGADANLPLTALLERLPFGAAPCVLFVVDASRGAAFSLQPTVQFALGGADGQREAFELPAGCRAAPQLAASLRADAVLRALLPLRDYAVSATCRLYRLQRRLWIAYFLGDNNNSYVSALAPGRSLLAQFGADMAGVAACVARLAAEEARTPGGDAAGLEALHAAFPLCAFAASAC